jgi:hypothetical protein
MGKAVEKAGWRRAGLRKRSPKALGHAGWQTAGQRNRWEKRGCGWQGCETAGRSGVAGGRAAKPLGEAGLRVAGQRNRWEKRGCGWQGSETAGTRTAIPQGAISLIGVEWLCEIAERVPGFAGCDCGFRLVRVRVSLAVTVGFGWCECGFRLAARAGFACCARGFRGSLV